MAPARIEGMLSIQYSTFYDGMKKVTSKFGLNNRVQLRKSNEELWCTKSDSKSKSQYYYEQVAVNLMVTYANVLSYVHLTQHSFHLCYLT